MSDLFDAFLKTSEIVVLDGALATELERRGANLDDPLWSARILLDAPDLIRQVHLDYLRAGADILTTASYQASFEGFTRLGISEKEATGLFLRSVRLAAEAREQFLEESPERESGIRPLIAASLGSFGAFLADGSEYRGEYGVTPSQLESFHRRRVEALLESSPDLLAFETVPSRLEGEVIAELAEDFPEISSWVSFSCCDELHICDGELFRDCVKAVSQSKQVVAAGLNCTSPHLVESLLHSADGSAIGYLLAYPNSGEGWDARNRRWISGGVKLNFGALARRWYDAGARLIGGCCRTAPQTIQSIRNEFSRELASG
jgi:homocysteine S-methyltransferase